MADSLEGVARWAIMNAKRHGRSEVVADDFLLGALVKLARFGVAQVGHWSIDLAALGIDWMDIEKPSADRQVTYSDTVVLLLDRAALVAKLDGEPQPSITHLLACFADEAKGIMAELRGRYGIESATWRGALAGLDLRPRPATQMEAQGPAAGGRPYLSPEEAAAYLGVHIQTLRGYIRTGKLRALRIAGERAIRIRHEDLNALLEPFKEEE